MEAPTQPIPSDSDRRSRRGARIALFAALVGIGLYFGYRWLDHDVKSVDVVLAPESIPADGVSSALLEIRLTSRFGNRLNATILPTAPAITIVEGSHLVRVVPLGDSLRYRLVAGFDRGRAVIRVHVPGVPAPYEEILLLTPSLADRNRNGYPDAVDLTSTSDRMAFRRWFVAIALGQLKHLDDQWQDRDCAGLLRYCFREALKKHDNRWLRSRRWLVTAAIPDVAKYNYPDVPLLGTRVFGVGRDEDFGLGPSDDPERRPTDRSRTRVTSSTRRHGLDLDRFAEFAEASRLKDNSMVFVSRSIEDAQPGDVVFYLNDTRSAWPYHTMVYAGNGTTVYHTGPDGDDPGIVKRMTLRELAAHPNPRWHPIVSNVFFLGFYRWRILADDEARELDDRRG